MLSKLKCSCLLRLFESGIGVLLPTFYPGSPWELKKLLYLIFIRKLGYPPSPLLPLILTKVTIYLPFLLLILMKMNTYVNVEILKFFIIPLFLGLAVSPSCSRCPRLASTRTQWTRVANGSSRPFCWPPAPEAQQLLSPEHEQTYREWCGSQRRKYSVRPRVSYKAQGTRHIRSDKSQRLERSHSHTSALLLFRWWERRNQSLLIQGRPSSQ